MGGGGGVLLPALNVKSDPARARRWLSHRKSHFGAGHEELSSNITIHLFIIAFQRADGP